MKIQVTRYSVKILLTLVIQLGIGLILMLPASTFGQSQYQKSKILSIIDSTQKIYGINDLLVDGQVYYQANRMATGTPFLFSSSFANGKIYTRGIQFNVEGINYDVASDNLVLLNTTQQGKRLHIQLSNSLVDSFELLDYLFVAPTQLKIDTKYNYLLAVNSGKYRLFLGYKKEFINRYSQRNPYGKFSSTKRVMFISTKDTLLRVNSKRTFIKTIPSSKKEISSYIKKHRIKLLQATPNQLKQLMEFYNKLMYNL